MSDPSFRPLNLGNTADDDAQVLDSLVQTESTPPTPPVQHIVTQPLPDPVIPTRLMSVRQTVDAAWNTPTQLLPADPRRVSLVIRCRQTSGGAADDGIYVMSDLNTGTGMAVLQAAGTTQTAPTSLDLSGHTGAVYAKTSGANSVIVDVWSVTK